MRHIHDSVQTVVVTDVQALHKGLSFDYMRSVVRKHMSAISNRSGGGTVIPMTIHWPGPNKPKEHVATQVCAVV